MKWLITLMLLICAESYAKDPDVAFCEKSNLNSYNGYYSLDYLLSRTNQTDDQFIKELSFENYKWYTYLSTIGFPGVGIKGEYFRVDILAPYSLGQMYIWESGDQGFPTILKYPVQSKLPKNCQSAGLQVFESSLTPLSTLIEYDPNLLANVEKTSELQKSFLMLRVYLSQFTDDSELIRSINFKLHLNSTFQNYLLAPEIAKLLQTKKPEISICDRSLSVSEALVKDLRKSCSDIKIQDITKITKLKIQDINRSDVSFKNFTFRSNDFKGFVNLKELDMSQLSWFGTSVFSYLFSDLKSLEVLNLSKSTIHYLWSGMFKGITNLKLLDLSKSTITGMLQAPFQGVFGAGSTLNLSEVMINNLGPNEFMGLESLENLILNSTSFGVLENNTFQSLKSLKYLDLSDRRSSRTDYKNNLNLAMLPSLETLVAVGNTYVMAQIQNLPTLKNLDISSTYFLNSELGQLAKFPNLEYLNLSNTNFRLPYNGEVFKNLKKLNHLVVEGLEFNDGTNYDQGFHDNLPASLTTYDVCNIDTDISFWKSLLRDLRKRRPNLKIRSKDRCMGDWIEITN